MLQHCATNFATCSASPAIRHARTAPHSASAVCVQLKTNKQDLLLSNCASSRCFPALSRSVRSATISAAAGEADTSSKQTTEASQEITVDSAAVLAEARARTGGSFVFSYDEADEDANLGPVSRFEEKMAAQAAAAVQHASPGGITKEAPIASATQDILSAYSQEQGFKEASVQEVHNLRQSNEGVFLLDVRSPEEFARMHATGAVNIPLDELTGAKGTKLPHEDTAICVICQSGSRSAQAAVKLGRVLGFTNVTNVEGGTSAWAAADLPVQQ